MSDPGYDVVTIGESMLRLSPPDHHRLEQASSLNIAVGGAESNVAIALCRLGLRVAWISCLVDDPLGRRVARAIQAEGVDLSHVVWVPKGRTGLYFAEFGRPPETLNRHL